MMYFIIVILFHGFHFVTCRRQELIMNLPQSVSVPENSDGGTLVYELMLSDPFMVDYTYHFDPTEGADIFEINHGSHSVFIKHGGRLDFESRTEYKIEFLPFPNNAQNRSAFKRKKRAVAGPVSYVLTINVTDVNEPPTFSSETYIFYVFEGPAKTLLNNVSFTATDPDINDVISYSLTSTTNDVLQAFSIDPQTGNVSYAVDYNVDNGAMADTAILYVNAHDSANSLATALIVIQVTDVNDNPPSFGRDSYTVFVPLGLPVNTNVLNLTAADPDQGLGGIKTFYESKLLSSPYFDIAKDASVYVSKDLDVNDTQIFDVIVADGYGLTGTASVTISILSGGITHTEPLSGSRSSQPADQSCCCTDIQKLTWMIPCLIIVCTLLLAILIFVTRKRNKVCKINNNE